MLPFLSALFLRQGAGARGNSGPSLWCGESAAPFFATPVRTIIVEREIWWGFNVFSGKKMVAQPRSVQWKTTKALLTQFG